MFAHRLVRGQDPVHRALRAQVHLLVEQCGEHFAGGSIDEAWRAEDLENALSLRIAEGPGRRRTGLLVPGSRPLAAVERGP